MIDKKVTKVIENIKQMNDSIDLVTRELIIDNTKIAYIFLESTSSDDKISNFLGKSLSMDAKEKKLGLFENLFNNLKNTIPNSKLKIFTDYKEMFTYLASGFTCVVVDGNSKGIAVETKNQLNRTVQDSSSEPILKGPKDSFIENIQINIGLIRKRIKDPNLCFTEIEIGRRTKTKVAVGYIKDIAISKTVKTITRRLEKIDIDGIIDSSYLRELLTKDQTSIFPRVISTERPDSTSIALLSGKVVILVDNTPFVLIFPGLFTDFFQSPEDYYSKPINASARRLVRYIAFMIAILTPGIYVAITTYNMEIIPNSLLISFAIQKESVPFPTVIEVIIMILAYEILREADTRKPQIMGASISIVGALILGEAAVTAGIISPIVVIVVSITAVSGMAFSDSDIVNAISFWRLLFLLGGCFAGLIGIFIVGMLFVIKLANLKSIDTPYLTPLAPPFFKDWKRSILRFPQEKLTKRPSYLAPKNLTRMRDE